MDKQCKIVGYTTGVYDLFHSGHVNLLRSAKSVCDTLIVGITTDDLVSYKGKSAVIPYEHRAEVVRACRYVDVVVPQRDIDKFEAWKRLKYDVLVVGDDWYGDEKWQQYEKQLSDAGAKVVYFPYTSTISTTQIVQRMKS